MARDMYLFPHEPSDIGRWTLKSGSNLASAPLPQILAMSQSSHATQHQVTGGKRGLLDAADAYARSGWPVFPLKPRDKRPLTRHGVHDASCDVSRVTSWWARRPGANIGLAILRGLIVVDVDKPEAMGHLQAQDLTLPATVTATTGRGRHLWYSTGSVAVRNRVGLFPGIDIRAPGGYVVAPPSVHPNGSVYRWEVPLQRNRIAQAPEWLLGDLGESSSRPRKSADDWLQKLREPVLQGRRNQALAEISGLLFRYLPAQVAAELADCWAQARLSPPLPEREVQRTIESIAGRELHRLEAKR